MLGLARTGSGGRRRPLRRENAHGGVRIYARLCSEVSRRGGRRDRRRLAATGACGCRRSLPTHFRDRNSRPDWRERAREAVGASAACESKRGVENRRAPVRSARRRVCQKGLGDERPGSLVEVLGRRSHKSPGTGQGCPTSSLSERTRGRTRVCQKGLGVELTNRRAPVRGARRRVPRRGLGAERFGTITEVPDRLARAVRPGILGEVTETPPAIER